MGPILESLLIAVTGSVGVAATLVGVVARRIQRRRHRSRRAAARSVRITSMDRAMELTADDLRTIEPDELRRLIHSFLPDDEEASDAGKTKNPDQVKEQDRGTDEG
jgi:hypothetical protein